MEAFQVQIYSTCRITRRSHAQENALSFHKMKLKCPAKHGSGTDGLISNQSSKSFTIKSNHTRLSKSLSDSLPNDDGHQYIQILQDKILLLNKIKQNENQLYIPFNK